MVHRCHRGRGAKLAGLIVGAAAVAVVMAAPAIASAQSELDEAQQLFEEANFETALAVLETAEQGSGLDRDGVIRLLLLRALVHHALGNRRALDESLRALATIAPDFPMDSSYPPAVSGRFEVVRAQTAEPLALSVETSAVSGGYEISASVVGDTGRLIREIQIATRIPEGEWLINEGSTARIPVAEGTVVDYYVSAIGPGGAVLLNEGSADEPRHLGHASTRAPSDLEQSLETPVEPPQRRISPWVWVGTGAAVAVVTAVVLAAVLATRDPSDTNVGPLEIDWR